MCKYTFSGGSAVVKSPPSSQFTNPMPSGLESIGQMVNVDETSSGSQEHVPRMVHSPHPSTN